MKKILGIVLMVVGLCLSGLLGYHLGSNGSNDISSQTFYAKIIAIEDRHLSVSGLSVNDVNYRGDFNLSVTDQTALEWRNTEIQLSDLRVGQTISITYQGEILESFPAVIQKVSKIQLLEDEK